MNKGKETKWKKRWRSWVAPTKLPGVWVRRDGGFLVRARVRDPETKLPVEIKKVLLNETETGAYVWLQKQVEQVRAGNASLLKARMRFSEYSASLLERKVATKEVKSARGREKWVYSLQHLIAGTEGVPGFGDMFIDQIHVRHVETWKGKIAKLVAAEEYSPHTVNGWINILFTILRAAKREFELEHDATKGVLLLDTSEHDTYSEEEPNALTEEEVVRFLNGMFDNYPQFFAMTYLGLATGLRPSSMRPLRRKGQNPDVLWETSVILIRRSHALGDEVMKTTKTGVKQRIHVPPNLMDVLKWHVETQLMTPEQKSSDLLFPAELGGFRGANCLQKPFKACADAAGFGKRFTPRGMRRTFNDLARRAKLDSLVIKSVSGHLTDRMKDHYSTVDGEEQREGLTRVLAAVKAEAVELAIKSEPSKEEPSNGERTTSETP